MAECDFLEKCPVFQKCQTGVIKRIFALRYCRGAEMEHCERRQLKLAGKEVPVNLLPNGEMLAH